jgi:hypothetical protein
MHIDLAGVAALGVSILAGHMGNLPVAIFAVLIFQICAKTAAIYGSSRDISA